MAKTFTPNNATGNDKTKGKEDDIMFEPSQYVLNNILNYSKVLSVRSSRMLGQIEFILN